MRCSQCRTRSSKLRAHPSCVPKLCPSADLKLGTNRASATASYTDERTSAHVDAWQLPDLFDAVQRLRRAVAWGGLGRHRGGAHPCPPAVRRRCKSAPESGGLGSDGDGNGRSNARNIHLRHSAPRGYSDCGTAVAFAILLAVCDAQRAPVRVCNNTDTMGDCLRRSFQRTYDGA